MCWAATARPKVETKRSIGPIAGASFLAGFGGCQKFHKKKRPSRISLERVMGIGPTLPAWKAGALPLSYTRGGKWSGRRGSDSRPPPWQGGALPTELLPHGHLPTAGRDKCGRRDLNSYALRHWNLNPARLPFRHARKNQAQADGSDPLEIRTPDTLIKSQVLCQLS